MPPLLREDHLVLDALWAETRYPHLHVWTGDLRGYDPTTTNWHIGLPLHAPDPACPFCPREGRPF